MSTPIRSQTPGKSPGKTPSRTPGRTPSSAQCSSNGCLYKLIAIVLVLAALTGVGGYFVYTKADKKGLTYYGIAVVLVVLTYFVVTKVVRKKKTE